MNLTLIEKEKIRYWENRMDRAEEKFRLDEYYHAKYVTWLMELGFDLELTEKEEKDLKKIVKTYELTNEVIAKRNNERFALTNAKRQAKAERRATRKNSTTV